MKHYILYFLLLIVAVPAAAQPGFFGKGPHGSRVATGQPCHGPLIKPGHSSHAEPQAMNPRDFEAAVRMINEENFDDKRLELAKYIIKSNPMSTRQIFHVCALFNFEANKLEFAKFAYPYCVDRNRYFLVDDVFNFSSSKDELHKFIQNWQ